MLLRYFEPNNNNNNMKAVRIAVGLRLMYTCSHLPAGLIITSSRRSRYTRLLLWAKPMQAGLNAINTLMNLFGERRRAFTQSTARP